MGYRLIDRAIAACREHDLGNPDKGSFLMLAHRAWDETGVWMGMIEGLAGEIGTDVTTMRRHFATLAKLGLIRRARVMKSNGQYGGSLFWLFGEKDAPWPMLENLKHGFQIIDEDEPKSESVQRSKTSDGGAAPATAQICTEMSGQEQQEHFPLRLEDKPLTSSPPKPKAKSKRFSVSPELAECRAVFAEGRRAGPRKEVAGELWQPGVSPSRQQQDLFNDLAREHGADAILTACKRYVERVGEYQTHFGNFLVSEVENFLPQPLSREKWVKAIRLRMQKMDDGNDWWPVDPLGPKKPGQEGCLCPEDVLEETGFWNWFKPSREKVFA